MNKIDVHNKALGVSFTNNGLAEVLVWAPKAQQVELCLNDGNTTIPLRKGEFGYWHETTDQLSPGDTYKFRLDEEQEYPDPASVSQPEGVHGPSQALDLLKFNWTDEAWQNLPLEDYVLYELHTGTFSEEGTFAGLEEKLDYLKDLGVNAIEIMPVAQFPGDRNWGYDGVFPFAVQDSYGGPKALQHLVNTCHQKGLAVVLDVVYNHLGPEGNYLGEYGHYFTDKYNTPWGQALNFDDAWCDGVRRYFTENLLMWFRDFHIDAVRMDAVHAIKDFSPNHILREMKQQVNELVEATGRTHYMIVELDLNDTRFINPLEEQGYGMDAQWVDEFHHALRVTMTGEDSGYYSDFSGIAHLAKAYEDAYVYDGQFSPHRNKTFGVKAAHNPGQQFIVFTQNHDQVGNRMLGERLGELVSYEIQKLAAAAVIFSPFLPMLWMGEEYGEPNRFQYFVSHTDPDLAEAVRNGRKAEFAAFHAQGEAPDPMDEETFQNSKLQWDLVQKGQHHILFRYYQTLLRLRRELPALKNLTRKNLEVSCDEARKTLTLRRWHGDQQIICLMNFNASAQPMALPSGGKTWNLVLDSAAPDWDGPQAAQPTAASGAQVTVQPESVVVYQA
ncbi:malto-oligosyltrehalose trehalohydrolase [Rufibacter glacialis]|uniref:Malto-oligosyltrehalose trehalohydrolase n=1 Tax=Rufibacter glacialis TaxID=1259555 RepID=A0A5M8QE96_9BACT|nr:malto-oligosyltrehalose trehalohydrolase [Rufibacter glacialis]KAA6434357.1 malto-oligosyltrehalose trehalohydrolase [Rufibacter glacialis]GGK68818.1 malto-oligosyltrehalose trehalohydrolase [Rufibacter glacialis]